MESLPGRHLRFLVRTLPVLPSVISTLGNSKQTQILNLGAVLIAWPNVTCPRCVFFLQPLLPSLSTPSVSWAVPRCRARNTRERQGKSARCSVFAYTLHTPRPRSAAPAPVPIETSLCSLCKTCDAVEAFLSGLYASWAYTCQNQSFSPTQQFLTSGIPPPQTGGQASSPACITHKFYTFRSSR